MKRITASLTIFFGFFAFVAAQDSENRVFRNEEIGIEIKILDEFRAMKALSPGFLLLSAIQMDNDFEAMMSFFAYSEEDLGEKMKVDDVAKTIHSQLGVGASQKGHTIQKRSDVSSRNKEDSGREFHFFFITMTSDETGIVGKQAHFFEAVGTTIFHFVLAGSNKNDHELMLKQFDQVKYIPKK